MVRRIKLEEAGVEMRRALIVVSPGAASGREPERFGEAAAKLSAALDSQVVVVADGGCRALAERVRRAAGDRARKLAGCLTLEERAAVLELAPLVLTDDDESLHLAAAVGTPVVQVIVPEQRRRTPWRVAHRVVAASHEGLTADAVVVAACDLWLDIHWRAAA